MSTPVTPTPTKTPSKGEVILEDILNDALLAAALAASIFVKNPGNQAKAGTLFNAATTLIQVIESQINGTPIDTTTKTSVAA